MIKKVALLLLAAGMAASVHGADFSVPALSLLTNGQQTADGAFVLSTRVDIDMLIAGGSKFDAWFKLGFRNATMEDYLQAYGSPTTLPDTPTADDLAAAIRRLEAASGLGLRTAAIQIRDVFGTPLQLATFVGHLDVFCSGADFPALFGSNDFATKFRGYMYYPNGIDGDTNRTYNGLHEVYGTGVRLSLPGSVFIPYLYAYQDSWLGGGYYSTDARIQYSADGFNIEAYAGASFPVASMGTYRAGLLFHYDTGAIGDFYAQIGIPRWDPSTAFGMDMLYFMFEPRVNFGFGTLTLSLFFHPAWYLQQQTGQSGAMEMRVDLGFGNMREGTIKGGVESELSYDPNLTAGALIVDAAPYMQFIRNGVRWDMRLGLRAFPFPDQWYGLFMPSVGVSTSF